MRTKSRSERARPLSSVRAIGVVRKRASGRSAKTPTLGGGGGAGAGSPPAPAEVLGAGRPLRELVGEAELRRDEDELRDPEAGREPEHLLDERRATAPRGSQRGTTASSRA